MKSNKVFSDNLRKFNETHGNIGSETVERKVDAGTGSDDESDPITRALGTFGKWQLFIVALMFLAKFPVAFHQMSIIFLAPPVKFHCVLPANTSSFGVEDHSDETPLKMFNMVCSERCERYIYDRSVFEETIVTEWNLVCDRAWLKDFTQTIFMFGILVGNMLFGYLADRFGRRRPLVIAVTAQLLFGVLASFAGDWYTLTALRFVVAVATGGTIVMTFVLIMEVVSKKHRELAGVLFQIPFNFGHILLAGIGYCLRSWHAFQLAVSLPSFLLLSYYWLLPESPRWLITTGRTEKAVEVMERAAKMNNLPMENIKEDVTKMSDELRSATGSSGQSSFMDLFRSGMWIKTLCLSFNWLVCGLGLFGVSHYIGHTNGDIFINVAISASVQIPGTIIATVANKKLGRKCTLIAGNVLTGASCLLITVVPELPVVHLLLAAMGILGMSVSFPTVYLYAGEVFPTIVRNSGVGFCSMIARIGSMAAPFVVGLATVEFWLPPLMFGLIPLIGAALCVFLPETRGKDLANTLQESRQADLSVSTQQV